MKNKILLCMSVVCFGITTLMAQGNMQRQTPEERTKATIEKMAPLNLDDATKTKATAIISEFYTARQAAMQEMRAGGNIDRDAMQAKNKELSDARDVKLKAIFQEEQYKKWITDIEPTLRPQRPQKN